MTVRYYETDSNGIVKNPSEPVQGMAWHYAPMRVRVMGTKNMALAMDTRAEMPEPYNTLASLLDAIHDASERVDYISGIGIRITHYSSESGGVRAIEYALHEGALNVVARDQQS